jgi:O-methyltransferase involved in polyketide biosynthesis
VGDLSVTALYTSQVWAWGGLSCAELLATDDAKRVFDVTNAALGIARWARPDMPELRYALLHRHAIIDYLLSETSGSVTEIAAGLSRRGAANCGERAYTEVDLAPVIAKKRELLARTAAGRAVLDKLVLVAGDVTTIELPPAEVVIAEGLVMYLDGEQRRRLFAKITAPRFIFDLVPSSEEPAPGRVGKLLEAAMKRFTGGRTFERDARTREQIVDELHAAGFSDVEVVSSAASRWPLPHADRATTMVVFSASRSTRA